MKYSGRSNLLRAYAVAALVSFAIPLGGARLSNHVIEEWDARFLDNLREALDRGTVGAGVAAAKKAAALANYEALPASVMCRSDHGRVGLPPLFATQVCPHYAMLDTILAVSILGMLLSLLSWPVVLGLAAAARRSRKAQLLSFRAGWAYLRIYSLLQVLLQSFIAVTLVLWAAAAHSDGAAHEAALGFALAIATAAGALIVAIFRRPDPALQLQAQPLSREQAPALWARIEALCHRLERPAPQHLIAGRHEACFATDCPVALPGLRLEGRTLHVHLPTLEGLGPEAGERLLAREIARTDRDDAGHGQRLVPLLARYDAYLAALDGRAWTRPLFHVMRAYRSLFRLSLGRPKGELGSAMLPP